MHFPLENSFLFHMFPVPFAFMAFLSNITKLFKEFGSVILLMLALDFEFSLSFCTSLSSLKILISASQYYLLHALSIVHISSTGPLYFIRRNAITSLRFYLLS